MTNTLTHQFSIHHSTIPIDILPGLNGGSLPKRLIQSGTAVDPMPLHKWLITQVTLSIIKNSLCT